jgi:hypothetical protein
MKFVVAILFGMQDQDIRLFPEKLTKPSLFPAEEIFTVTNQELLFNS